MYKSALAVVISLPKDQDLRWYLDSNHSVVIRRHMPSKMPCMSSKANIKGDGPLTPCMMFPDSITKATSLWCLLCVRGSGSLYHQANLSAVFSVCAWLWLTLSPRQPLCGVLFIDLNLDQCIKNATDLNFYYNCKGS